MMDENGELLDDEGYPVDDDGGFDGGYGDYEALFESGQQAESPCGLIEDEEGKQMWKKLSDGVSS